MLEGSSGDLQSKCLLIAALRSEWLSRALCSCVWKISKDRTHNLSGQSVVLLKCLHREKGFPYI